MHQGQGGVDHAVDAVPQGGGEDLLRGHIGDEEGACLAVGAAAGPEVILRQTDGEVRAEAVGIVEGGQAQLVELLRPALDGLHVLLPALHGPAVPLDADGLQDGVPELVHGLLLGDAGEDGPGPGGDGEGGNAPGDAVAHLLAVEGVQRQAPGPVGPGQAVRVHAPQGLGVPGGEGEVGRALQGVVIEEVPPPEGDLVEDGVVRVEVTEAVQLVIPPVHHHFPAAGGIGLLRAHPGKPRAVHRRGDDEGLALLDVEAHADQEPGILPELFRAIFHICSFPGGHPPLESSSSAEALAGACSCRRRALSFRRAMRVPLSSAPRMRMAAVKFSQIRSTITAPMEP